VLQKAIENYKITKSNAARERKNIFFLKMFSRNDGLNFNVLVCAVLLVQFKKIAI
jgi:hypothetical protein